jgi:hypothetical protein
MFTDMYKYTAGQRAPFSNSFIFPDMWIAYKKSQNILEDTMKSVKDVVVLTGMYVMCMHVYCMSSILVISKYSCTSMLMHTWQYKHCIVMLLSHVLSLVYLTCHTSTCIYAYCYCCAIYIYIYIGDIHTAFAMEQPGKCVEFVGMSVTSAGFYEFFGQYQLPSAALLKLVDDTETSLKQNDNIFDVELNCHGYFITRYTREAVYADYYCVNNIHDASNTGEYKLWDLKTCTGTSKIVKATDSCPTKP